MQLLECLGSSLEVYRLLFNLQIPKNHHQELLFNSLRPSALCKAPLVLGSAKVQNDHVPHA